MLRGYSVEVNPRDARIVDAALGRLDAGTEVFLVWIPGADPMDMVAPAAKMQRAGLFPVPHIGARHIESKSQLEQLVVRLASEAGVDRVLIVGGDRDRPAGPYDSALAVMQSGALPKAGIIRTAVAGFPEGNPHISETVLAEALAEKVDFARNAGLQLSIVTQFCFEAEPVLKWLRHIRAAAIDVPVRVGLAGPAGLITLTRYAIRCGVGNSLRVLTEKPSFAKLLIENGPEPIIRGIISSVERRGAATLPLGIAGFHFFTFGGFNRTIDWINAGRTQ
jgi:methylenetetrahydrofolate reductase (NADPH)